MSKKYNRESPHRLCLVCGDIKPLHEFMESVDRPGQHGSMCQGCYIEAMQDDVEKQARVPLWRLFWRDAIVPNRVVILGAAGMWLVYMFITRIMGYL